MHKSRVVCNRVPEQVPCDEVLSQQFICTALFGSLLLRSSYWNYCQLGRAWDILRVVSPYRGRNGDFSTWRTEVCALIIHMGDKESQDMSGQRPKAGEARINCGDGIGKPARVPRVRTQPVTSADDVCARDDTDSLLCRLGNLY